MKFVPAAVYLDTSIWRDYFEDRRDGLRPLGEFAFRFLKECAEKGFDVIVSDTVTLELGLRFSESQIPEVFSAFKGSIRFIDATSEALAEAKHEWAARERNLPFNDVLHAVLAKRNGAVLIARDRHFEALSEIVKICKPEEFIFR